MNAVVDLEEIIRTLKGYETYGYQVAYYLLQEQNLAMDATKGALLRLSRQPDFYQELPVRQKQIVKRTVINHALAVKRKVLCT